MGCITILSCGFQRLDAENYTVSGKISAVTMHLARSWSSKRWWSQPAITRLYRSKNALKRSLTKPTWLTCMRCRIESVRVVMVCSFMDHCGLKSEENPLGCRKAASESVGPQRCEVRGFAPPCPGRQVGEGVGPARDAPARCAGMKETDRVG